MSTTEAKINPQHPTTYWCYVDGGCLGNGGHNAEAYGSYLVVNADEVDAPYAPTEDGHNNANLLPEVARNERFLITNTRPGQRVTNNIAEAKSMASLITELYRLRLVRPSNLILVHSDSELIINQMTGAYRVKNQALKEIYRDIRQFISRAPGGVELFKEVVHLCKISGDQMKVVLGH